MIELRPYQETISARGATLLKDFRICYLAMECRTGKTLTALACAQKYGAKSVLVVSKLKAIPSIRADYDALKPAFSLQAVNYESAHKAKGGFDLVILDEAHSLGAFPRPSKRTKVVRDICKGLPIIYLSGTPSPESFSQLYHQFWVSSFSPFRLFPNFYKWAKRYVSVRQKMVNGHMLNDYSCANKESIDAACKHLFIDYTQDEAGFEANIREESLISPTSALLKSLLRTLAKDRIATIGNYSIVADTPAKLLTKIHQLSSGTVIDEDGRHLVLDRSKAEFVKNYFRGRKLAIFYVYQSEADLLKEVFPRWTASPEEFQQSADLVFLGQVRSAREGVRLDTADALVFFNLEYSYLSYEQGRNRLSSKERTAPARVYFVCSDCGIECDILEAVRSKKDYTYAYFKHKQGYAFGK